MRRDKIIEEIAQKIYLNKDSSPFSKIGVRNKVHKFKTQDQSFNSNGSPSPRKEPKNDLSLDKIEDYVRHNLQDKDKISLQDINDIEKRITQAYEKILNNLSAMRNTSRSPSFDYMDKSPP